MLAEGSDKEETDIDGESNRRISHDGNDGKLAETGSQLKEKVCQVVMNQESGMVTGSTDTMSAMSGEQTVPSVDVAREYIRLQIARLGLTEKDFCIRVGIPQSSINDILKGKRRAHFDHLDKINQALGIGTGSMFKVMCEIARAIEASGGGYAAIPGRSRGYVLADQKEPVKRAIDRLRKPHRGHRRDDP